MCREERRIYFSNPELVDAISMFCKASGRIFPFDRSSDMSFKNASQIVVRISTEHPEPRSLEFFETEIAAGLIMLCQQKGIPVARKSLKSLELSHGHIIFVMRSPETNPRHLVQA